MGRKLILVNKDFYPSKIRLSPYGVESCASAYYDTHPLIRMMFRMRLKKALSLIPDHTYNNILDIGTGIGAFLPTLTDLTKNTLVGLDVSSILDITKKMLKKVKIERVELVKSDLTSMPFGKEHFDLIICLSVLEHVKNSEKSLKEIRRVISDKGVLIVGWPIESEILNSLRKIDAMLRPEAVKIGKKAVSDGKIRGHISHHVNLRRALKESFKVLKMEGVPTKRLRIYDLYACKKL